MPGKKASGGEIFITATDTGVGKTVVSAGLAAAIRRRGLDIGVMKPFATGAVRGRSEDVEHLIRAAGVEDPRERVNPILLDAPLAPSEAARLAGKRIPLDRVWKAYRELSATHERMIVEGVGGILVPVKPRTSVAQVIRRLRLPAVIVTRPTLGTVNHTLLTVQAARANGIRLLGLVINDHGGFRKGLAERLNPGTLRRETRLPILAEIPYLGRNPFARLTHPVFSRLASRLFTL